METSIKIFENAQFGNIRVATTESGEPLFCLKDLCDSLSLSNSRVVVQRLDKEEVRKLDLRGQVGETNFVTESGMYTVILRSDSPLAKPMQKWVTSEVLPCIRKHGMYATPSTLDEMVNNPDLIIGLATKLKEERAEKERLLAKTQYQQQELIASAPKINYYNNVLQSESLITTNIIAKELGMSAVTLNKILSQKKIIYNQSGTWVLYHKYQNMALTGTKTYTFKDSTGKEKTSIQTYWTEKGRVFLHQLLESNNISLINPVKANMTA